jgi:hypothetical protein
VTRRFTEAITINVLPVKKLGVGDDQENDSEREGQSTEQPAQPELEAALGHHQKIEGCTASDEGAGKTPEVSVPTRPSRALTTPLALIRRAISTGLQASRSRLLASDIATLFLIRGTC